MNGSLCGGGINYRFNTTTAAVPYTNTAQNSLTPATYVAPVTPPSQAGGLAYVPPSDLSAIIASSSASLPSTVSPPSSGLSQFALDEYAAMNHFMTWNY